MSNITPREQQGREIVAKRIKQIEMLTGDKKKASAYGSALVNMANNPNLMNCSVDSILNVGFEIVQAGLNPNPLFGQAYVVPFKGSAQLQIGYKGWISLGYRHGWRFKAVPVYKCDDFSLEFGGFEDVIHLEPNYDARDESEGDWVHKNLIGVIVYAKDNTDTIFTEFVSFKKIEKLRLKSQNQKSADKLTFIWLEFAEEMYKAKALKYVITRLPITEEIMSAAIQEDKVHHSEEQKEQQKDTDLNALIAQKPTQKEVPHDEETGEVIEAQVDEDQEQEKVDAAISSNYPNFIKAGVKRSDLQSFVQFANLTADNVDDLVGDEELMGSVVEQFYGGES